MIFDEGCAADGVELRGDVHGLVMYDSGETREIGSRNTILTLGRHALAQVLTNEVGPNFQLYVNRMIFGTSGISGGVPRFVDAGRTGLFGLTALSKPIISAIDPNVPGTAIFTTVISNTEGNGLALNEMALQMANGNLYSMRTFANLNKTSDMSVVWTWRISLL